MGPRMGRLARPSRARRGKCRRQHRCRRRETAAGRARTAPQRPARNSRSPAVQPPPWPHTKSGRESSLAPSVGRYTLTDLGRPRPARGPAARRSPEILARLNPATAPDPSPRRRAGVDSCCSRSKLHLPGAQSLVPRVDGHAGFSVPVGRAPRCTAPAPCALGSKGGMAGFLAQRGRARLNAGRYSSGPHATGQLTCESRRNRAAGGPGRATRARAVARAPSLPRRFRWWRARAQVRSSRCCAFPGALWCSRG